ncbi:glycosyltransferase family 4 protein [Ulvibacterium sp.]|uniref:glycosyltransferase family 4 protein n=1 Tax=Ulvibacterium sp. TaxID=2665914 RepID=UPI003CC6CD24
MAREYLGSKRAGGIATYIHEVSKIMAQMGHRVYIICASDEVNRSRREVIGEITYIYLSGADYFIHSNRYLQLLFTKIREVLFYNSYRKKVVFAINQLQKEVGLDLIEFPEFGNEAKYWLRTENRNITTIVRFHGPSGHNRATNVINTRSKRVKNELITSFKADGISFCSRAIRHLLLDNDFSYTLISNYEGTQKVIFNPVVLGNTISFKPSNTKFIFAAGSFVENKGFKELIEALKLLNKDNHIELVIAGKLGRLGIEYLKKAQQEDDYKDWLNILGPIDRKLLYSYYRQAEICCFPSYWDNMPLTCLEAMSVGGLVLGSSSGGMKEIIENGVDGFLARPKDIILLKNNIEIILNLKKPQKNSVRKMAINKIENNFSSQVIYEQMFSFYNQLNS